MKKLRVMLIGYGYWGKNLLRCLMSEPCIEVVSVCDRDLCVENKVKAVYPGVNFSGDFREKIFSGQCDAVVISTPVSSHFEIAKFAIEHKKHVLIEKPMCASSVEAETLLNLAKKNNVHLMVDHTYIFHPVVRQIKSLIDSGDLGKVSYLDSRRVNLGLFQPDVDVVWDLGPHDFSIMQYLLDAKPTKINATGYCHVNKGLSDMAYITASLEKDMLAHFSLSWMSPTKRREIFIGGSKRMLVWDDLDNEQPLKIYDSGITIKPSSARETLVPSYRDGSIYCPKLLHVEPLFEVIKHFVRVILAQEKPVISGAEGLECVKFLESVSSSINKNELPIPNKEKSKTLNFMSISSEKMYREINR